MSVSSDRHLGRIRQTVLTALDGIDMAMANPPRVRLIHREGLVWRPEG